MVVSFIFTTVCSQIINKGTKKAGFCDCVRRRYAHVSSCCFGSTKHINSLDKESANLQWESAGERAKWLCLNRIFRENFSSFAQFLRHRHRHRCCRRRRHSHCPQDKKIEFGRLHDSTVSCALSAQNTAHPWERHNRTLYKKKRTGTCDAHTSHQQQPTGIMSDNILNTTPHLNVYLKHNIAAIPFQLLFLSFHNISVSLLISLQITNDER